MGVYLHRIIDKNIKDAILDKNKILVLTGPRQK
jgi:hypothetical protein